MVIGLDFDNTLISYDALMHRICIERRWIEPSVPICKKDIRDCLRLRPGGEIEWQELQGMVYGPRLAEAGMIDGVVDFCRRGRGLGAQLYIVSHKTEYAGYDETRTNLRLAALTWMQRHHFFDETGLGFSIDQVYFAPTRSEKIEQIARLGCTHFIDDLEEVFWEATFPEQIKKILFAPHGSIQSIPSIKSLATWEAVGDYVFGSDN